MEEYIKLKEEKAHWHDKVYNWETAKYGFGRDAENVYTGDNEQEIFLSHAWRRLFEIRAPLVQEFILEFFSTCRIGSEMGLDVTATLCFQLGGARRSMTCRQFILALGLHTAKEMAEGGFKAYWLGSERVIPDKGDLNGYWIEISSDREFLISAPSYTYIRDSVRRLCHKLIYTSFFRGGRHLKRHAKGRKSGARLLGGHFIGRLAYYFGLVSDDRLRGLSIVTHELPLIDMGDAKDAPNIDKGAYVILTPIHAPPPPPPTAVQILLPLWTQDPPFSSNSKGSPCPSYKPSREEEKNDSKDPRNEDSEVPSTEDLRVNQEKDANVNITNNIKTISLTNNVASIENSVVDENIVYGCGDDPNMPGLEDISIFEDSNEDVFNAEADLNNMESTFHVSPIPITRIHKDHPLKQLLRDLHLAPQTRRISKNLEEHGLDFVVYQMDVKSDFLYGKIKEETSSTPIKIHKTLLKDEKGKDVDEHLYRSMTGSLMYLTSSRPDIMFACKKQTMVANSITEAEYVVASSCYGQVLWIQNKLLDYGYNFMTKIHIENESKICIVKNLVFHSKTKHIKIRHHFIRDSNEKKIILMIKIHTNNNVAALLQKHLMKDVWNEMEKLLRMKLTTTKAKNINKEAQIHAKVDGKKVVISKVSIERDLRMVKNSDSATKFLMFSRFVQVFLNNQLEEMANHTRIYVTLSHTKKIFGNIKRVGKGFARRDTPLFPTMMVQVQEPLGFLTKKQQRLLKYMRLLIEEGSQVAGKEKEIKISWIEKIIQEMNKSYGDIKELFDKAMERINSFIDYRTELVEENSKKAQANIAQESSSKREGDELE
nr:hypothetical protein [Tanacetum cinerariifolium]